MGITTSLPGLLAKETVARHCIFVLLYGQDEHHCC